jgi:hypothetical protein
MAQGELPAGFDEVRVHAAANSLERKRARVVARAWPSLSRALGQRFDELFAVYAKAMPAPRENGPLADGRAFANWLAAKGELPEAGRLQALAVDLRYTSHAQGLTPRRWPTCKTAWLRASGRLVVALWLPWLGERWLSIPLGGNRHAEEGLISRTSDRGDTDGGKPLSETGLEATGTAVFKQP